MTVIRKKAFKDVPVSIKVRKPHYYYQDLFEVYPSNYVVLKPFEGLDYEFRKGVVKFYEKPLWNYKISPDIKRVLAPKGDSYLTIESTPDFYSVVGNLSVYKNVVSGFSSTDYIKPNFTFAPKSNPWEMMFKVKTGILSGDSQCFYQSCSGTGESGRFGILCYIADGKWRFAISTTNSAWLFDTIGTYEIQPYTIYWIKITFNGTKYELSYSLNGKDFIVDISQDSTVPVYNSLPNTYIGIYSTKTIKYPWLGSIDLNECYIKINNEIVWDSNITKDTVVEEKGCLDEGVNVYGAKNLTAFVRGTEIILSDDEEKEGYTWGGNVKAPNVLTKVYKKKFIDSSSDCTYSTSGDNILISYKSNGYSLLKEDTYYNFIPETSFFDYDVRFTAKVTTGTSSTHRIIGRVGVWLTWSSGKLQAIDKSLVCDGTLANNTTYWVRVGESYDVSTNQYTHRVCYIKDNGYTRETLPDESSWTVKTLTNTTRWFNSTTQIIGLGDVDAQNKSFSWDGTIDLTNCWIDYGNITNIGDNTRIYEIKWEILEKV